MWCLSRLPTSDAPVPVDVEPRTHHLLVLSGKTDSSLAQVAKPLWRLVRQDPPMQPSPMHVTPRRSDASTGSIEHRWWWNPPSKRQSSCGRLNVGESLPGLIRGQASKSPKLAWMFTGEGSESFGMGETLYRTQPVFRDVVDRCRRTTLARPRGLADSMRCSAIRLCFRNSAWKQPAVFVLQAALAELWRSWGVEPDLVLGRWIGTVRGCLRGGRDDLGRWLAVGGRAESPDERGSQAPTALVVGTKKRPVAAEASVTASTEILDQFEQFADTIDYFPADRPLICNLSGDIVPVHRLLGGSYWKRHCSEPFQFANSIATLAAQDCKLVLEIGPDVDLSEFAASCWPGNGSAVHAVHVRDQNETECLLTCARANVCQRHGPGLQRIRCRLSPA